MCLFGEQETYYLWRRNRSNLTWDKYTGLKAAEVVFVTAEKTNIYCDCITDILSGDTDP